MRSEGSRIGWIGLGRFGLPMALNLCDQGAEVFGVELASRRDATGQKHLGQVRPLSALPDADLLCLCLPDMPDIEAVMTELQSTPPPAILNFSTISPEASQMLFYRLGRIGVAYVDAPVSGSVGTARSGDLTVFVGAIKDQFPVIDHVLGMAGSNVFYMGGPGLGNAAKLVNQIMHLGNMAVIGLGLRVATELGVSFGELLAPLRTASSNSAMLIRFGDQVAACNPEAHFPLRLAAKDLGLVANNTSISEAPLFSAIVDAFANAMDVHGGEVNFSMVANALAAQMQTDDA